MADRGKKFKNGKIKIEELRLHHFKAFKNARLTLEPGLTFVIGHNGSGKSSLLDAIDFVRSALSEGLLLAVNQKGGIDALAYHEMRPLPFERELPDTEAKSEVSEQPKQAGRNRSGVTYYLPHISVVLSLDDRKVLYGFSITGGTAGTEFAVVKEELATEDGRDSFVLDNKGFRPSSDTGIPSSTTPGLRTTLRLPIIQEENPVWRAVYKALTNVGAYSIFPGTLRELQPTMGYDRLRRNGENASGVLWHLLQESRQDVQWIVERLGEITPNIRDLSVVFEEGRGIICFDQDSVDFRNRFSASHMSDGTLRALGILLALRQKNKPSMAFIDEIGDSIDPRTLSVLLGAIEVSTEFFPVVVTTHSTDILDYSAVNGKNVRVVEWWDGVSWIYPLHDNVKALLGPSHKIGSMLKRNTLRTGDVAYTISDADFFKPVLLLTRRVITNNYLAHHSCR